MKTMRRSLAKRLSPIIVIALLAILVLPRPSFIRAEGLTNSTVQAVTSVQQEQQNQFTEKLRNLNTNKKTGASEARTAAAEKGKTDKIVQFSNKLHDRFRLYDSRLTQILDRLQERITTYKEQGKDTTDAQAKLDKARRQLETAQQNSESAVNMFGVLSGGVSEEERAQAKGAEEKVTLARQDYIKDH